MAEVPDIVQCATSNNKVTGAESEETPVLPSENAENLTMDAEDSLPAVPTPSTIAEGASSFIPPDSGASAEYEVNDNMPVSKRIEMLEEQELIMARRNAGNFYSMLLALYFADLDFQKSRICRLRVEAMLVRPDPQLKTMMIMAKRLEEREFGAALNAAKEINGASVPLRKVISAVEERLRLYILVLVQISYVSIDLGRLAEMLDIPPLKLPEILNGYGWVVSPNNFVYPRMSQEFTAALDAQKKTPFGPVCLKTTKGVEKKCPILGPAEALKSLAKFVSSMET